MGRKIIWSITIFIIIFLGTGCEAILITPSLQNNDTEILTSIVNKSSKIQAIYYEEVPQASIHSGGVRIENTSKIWFKDNKLRNELEVNFFKHDELLYIETIGELYDYNSLEHTRYYLGPYPEHARMHSSNFQGILTLPRDQTILWYLDWITIDNDTVEEGVHAGEDCFILDILVNSSGSTRLWLSKEKGLPVKIVTNYNGNTSVREYRNFKVGEDAFPDSALSVPSDAIIF